MSRDSYESTTAPRRRREPCGRWAFVDLEELRALRRAAGSAGQLDVPDEEPLRPTNRCTICGAEGVGMILHPNPDALDGRRCICGDCQGKAHARRAGVAPLDDRR